LFIDPEDCIDCNACAPECVWEAIFREDDVPEAMKPDVALNALVRERRSEFRVPEVSPNPRPTQQQVADNKGRWGLEA
jgi:ferredoxin